MKSRHILAKKRQILREENENRPFFEHKATILQSRREDTFFSLSITYVRFLRINYAKELLIGTDMNIVDISLESGFDCLRSFNRVFKEETGMTPLKYCKNSA